MWTVRILIVEDELKMASLLSRGLMEEGMQSTSSEPETARCSWHSRWSTTPSFST